VADPPPARIRIPDVDMEKRISTMFERIEALAGKTHRAATPADARGFVAAAIEGKSAVASNAPFLAECGIATLGGVRSGVTDREELRALCAVADVGITSADYALADTGSLVMIASPREARLITPESRRND
jgi:L-lactate utilization protein LutB